MTQNNEPPKNADWPPKMAVAVGAVVLRDDKVLLIRQARGASLAGQWSIPWGMVDEGETPEAAALRETHEESGVTAELDGLLGIQNLRTPGWLSVIFACRHIEGIPTPDDIETDQAAYFSLAELDSLHDPIEPWCEWLVRRVLQNGHAAIPQTPDTPYHPHKAFLALRNT